MKNKFAVDKFAGHDKEVVITENGSDDWSDLRIAVDYDDVNHYEIDKKIDRLIELLNTHW